MGTGLRSRHAGVSRLFDMKYKNIVAKDVIVN